MNVGDRIKKWREARNMTRKRLADLAGISHTHVRNLEEGVHSPTLEMLENIAEALNVPFLYLATNLTDDQAGEREIAVALKNLSEENRKYVLKQIDILVRQEAESSFTYANEPALGLAV